VEKARAVGAITVPHTLRGFVLKAIQAYTPTFDRMLQHEMNKAQKGEQVEYEDLAAKPSPAPKNGPIALGGRD
jgi:hypothetical protein